MDSGTVYCFESSSTWRLCLLCPPDVALQLNEYTGWVEFLSAHLAFEDWLRVYNVAKSLPALTHPAKAVTSGSVTQRLWCGLS